MLKRPYTYTVLRYLHDPSTFEFVNVGVVMLCAGDSAPALLLGKVRTTIGRLREFFPVDREAFRSTMNLIQRGIARESKRIAEEGLFRTRGDAVKCAEQIVPADSSSLQWSPVIAGVTDDPEKTFDSIFRRMVTKYDRKGEPRRSDDEIWRPVRAELDRRELKLSLEPKVIIGGDDRVEFQHAWKNGVWHVYEPLSLDLADAEGIYRKAHRWLGQLTSVGRDATEPFKPHFIVGAPTDPNLCGAYERALKIILKSPVEVKIYNESAAAELVDFIEDEYHRHLAS